MSDRKIEGGQPSTPDPIVPTVHCSFPGCTATFANAIEAKKSFVFQDTDGNWYCELHQPKLA